MRNEIVVTYGLIGKPPPRANRMPPTTEVTANATLSRGVRRGDAVTRIAAAAGVTSNESTSSAPTIWIDTAVASPSMIMKAIEMAVTGSPFARATSASTLAKLSGRQTTNSPAITTAEMITSMSSWGLSTDTIWPVSSPNLLALRPL